VHRSPTPYRPRDRRRTPRSTARRRSPGTNRSPATPSSGRPPEQQHGRHQEPSPGESPTPDEARCPEPQDGQAVQRVGQVRHRKQQDDAERHIPRTQGRVAGFAKGDDHEGADPGRQRPRAQHLEGGGDDDRRGQAAVREQQARYPRHGIVDEMLGPGGDDRPREVDESGPPPRATASTGAMRTVTATAATVRNRRSVPCWHSDTTAAAGHVLRSPETPMNVSRVAGQLRRAAHDDSMRAANTKASA